MSPKKNKDKDKGWVDISDEEIRRIYRDMIKQWAASSASTSIVLLIFLLVMPGPPGSTLFSYTSTTVQAMQTMFASSLLVCTFLVSAAPLFVEHIRLEDKEARRQVQKYLLTYAQVSIFVLIGLVFVQFFVNLIPSLSTIGYWVNSALLLTEIFGFLIMFTHSIRVERRRQNSGQKKVRVDAEQPQLPKRFA